METEHTLLVVDDDISIQRTLRLILERNGYSVLTAGGRQEAIHTLKEHPDVGLVLMDMNYGLQTDGEDGLVLLKSVKTLCPGTPVILMTAWGSIDLAVRGMRNGAFDFLTKPWDNGVLMERVKLAIELSRPIPQQTTGNLSATSVKVGDAFVVGQSAALRNTLDTVRHIAGTNAPVLITGESGTGKELIAQAVHEWSLRSQKPFVKVNLGGISSSLFESEMFGHAKGSFTGAIADRKGRFEMAEGGTIFLDEIGDLEPASQVKLLRVLQDHTYEVLGDSKTRKADVRIICATNAPLKEMVRQHTFREDLYYRINLVHLHLPPLRQRPEDIPLLVRHFSSMPVAEEAMRYLQTLPFSGNIRELKNLVERTVLMASGEVLTADDFQQNSNALSAGSPTYGAESAPMTLEELEMQAIQSAITKHRGNLSMVAKELGISRGALYRKIEKHGLG